MLLGDFVDEYTVKVVDVFAMPQSGTAVSVETIDEIFQQEMLELLKATNRTENVVGCTGLVSLASRFWLLAFRS